MCLCKTRPMAGKDECGGQQVVLWSQTERVWLCKTRQRARSAMAIFAVFLFTRWGMAVRHSRRSKHAVITTRLRCWLALSLVGTSTSCVTWSHTFMLDLHLKVWRHTSKAQLLYCCCVSVWVIRSLELQELGAVCTLRSSGWPLCARHRRL